MATETIPASPADATTDGASVVREFAERLNRGAYGELRPLLHPLAVYRTTTGEDLCGSDGILRMLRGIGEVFDVVRLDLRGMAAGRRHVVVEHDLVLGTDLVYCGFSVFELLDGRIIEWCRVQTRVLR